MELPGIQLFLLYPYLQLSPYQESEVISLDNCNYGLLEFHCDRLYLHVLYLVQLSISLPVWNSTPLLKSSLLCPCLCSKVESFVSCFSFYRRQQHLKLQGMNWKNYVSHYRRQQYLKLRENWKMQSFPSALIETQLEAKRQEVKSSVPHLSF